MATLAQIKAAVETLKDTIGPVLVRRQNHYFSQHGKYWQGILTPSTPPDDGASVVADYTRKPTDQSESWADRFSGADSLPATLKAQIRVDTYDGPSGKGWTVTLRITKSGKTYARTWNFGPEDRDTSWADVTVPVL
jgi:hypothetical protein